MSEGNHTLYYTVTDAAQLTSKSKTWTFTVHNKPPNVKVQAPTAGDVVTGHSIYVAATATSYLGLPIKKVVFYLDPTSYNYTPPAPPPAPNGTLLGTATTLDSNGYYSITWDSTAVPFGDHIIAAWAYELYPTGAPAACVAYNISPIVSFNLVAYTPPTVSALATPTSGAAPLAVAFAATVTGGAAPFSYAWDFGDSSSGTGSATTHTYTTPGTYTWKVTLTDGYGSTASATGTVTAINPVIPPVVSGVVKATDPFRLKISGTNFHSNCTVMVNGSPVPSQVWKSSTQVNAKGGSALKAMLPKGVTVQITVKNNDDGGVSANFPYTR